MTSDTHPEISQAAARAMLAALKVDEDLYSLGYTIAVARYIGSEAEVAFLEGGPGGLSRWARDKRRAAIAAATRGGES